MFIVHSSCRKFNVLLSTKTRGVPTPDEDDPTVDRRFARVRNDVGGGPSGSTFLKSSGILNIG